MGNPIPDANHGAGIFTYITGPYFFGSFVGKYSSTMVRIWDRFSCRFLHDFPTPKARGVRPAAWAGKHPVTPGEDVSALANGASLGAWQSFARRLGRPGGREVSWSCSKCVERVEISAVWRFQDLRFGAGVETDPGGWWKAAIRVAWSIAAPFERPPCFMSSGGVKIFMDATFLVSYSLPSCVAWSCWEDDTWGNKEPPVN